MIMYDKCSPILMGFKKEVGEAEKDSVCVCAHVKCDEEINKAGHLFPLSIVFG